MSKTLVAYFSAQGKTAKVAGELAEHLGADLFEIKPLHPYTDADLRYTNPLARCNKEKFGKKDVPVAGKVNNFADYDEVFIGKTAEKLKPYVKGAISVSADLVNSADDLKK